MAIGIPFGALALVILFLSKGDIMGTDAKYALALIGFILVLSFIVTLVWTFKRQSCCRWYGPYFREQADYADQLGWRQKGCLLPQEPYNYS